MPAVSERQRRFMGAELSRKRRGEKTRTDMSESKLEDFTSKPMGDVMEKNVVKAISKYLGKTDEDSKTALAAFSTKPKTPKEAAKMVEGRRKFEEAAAKITPPKRVIAKENDYPPIKGESRAAKRAKAKKMKVTGAGTKNLQRIIGQKAKAGGGVNKQQEESVLKAITVYIKDEAYPKSKAIDLTGVKPPKEMADRARKALAAARTQRRAKQNGQPASYDRKQIALSKDKQLIKAISVYLKQASDQYRGHPGRVSVMREIGTSGGYQGAWADEPSTPPKPPKTPRAPKRSTGGTEGTPPPPKPPASPPKQPANAPPGGAVVPKHYNV